MRLGILAIIALLLGTVLAHFLMAERGYVLISFLGYTVEMSVPIMILGLIILYILTRLLLRLLAAPRSLAAVMTEPSAPSTVLTNSSRSDCATRLGVTFTATDSG